MPGDERVHEIRVLGGSIAITDPDGKAVEVRGKAARLLAYLVSRANSAASINDIIGVVWSDLHDPNLVSQKRVEHVVSEVRDLFKPDGRRIIPPRQYERYRLVADAEGVWVDAVEFDRLTREARAALEAGDARAARDLARGALLLWKADPVVLTDEWKHLQGRRRKARLTLGEALVLGSQQDDAVPYLASYVEDYGDDERGWELFVHALAATDRMVDARRACADARSRFGAIGGVGPRLSRICTELAQPGNDSVEATDQERHPEPGSGGSRSQDEADALASKDINGDAVREPPADRAPPPKVRRRLILVTAGLLAGVALGLPWWIANLDAGVGLAGVGDRLAIGDYNRDGRADVAMAYDVGDGRMRIYRWTSTGSAFSSASESKSSRVGAVAGRMASGDVNGDGADDVVLAGQNDDATFSYHVWLAGSTYAGKWYTSGPFKLTAVGDRLTVGDYNSDGKADVAMAYDAGDGTTQIHLSTSTGSGFTQPAAYPSESVGLGPVGDRMASGDVDGDGKYDIVMAHQNADGTFSYHVWMAGRTYVGKWYTSGQFNLNLVEDRLTIADYTGDGKADVAMAYDAVGGNTRIYRWTSTGSSFAELTRNETPAFNLAKVAGRMGSGDVDGDGKYDIVMAHRNTGGEFSYRVWSAGTSDIGDW